MNTTQSLTPDKMTDRQFLGWNQQVRSQLVEDLYDTCRQDGEILEALVDEYVWLLDDTKVEELKEFVKKELEHDYA